MTHTQRARIALHGTATTCLAFVAVQYVLYGPWPIAVLFGLASLAPIDAAVRETERTERPAGTHTHAKPVRPGDRSKAPLPRRLHPADTASVDRTVTELNTACCERWWTALGTDHDPTCRNQQRRSAA
ncbi:hypothetical protein DSC45_14425 [Streptomyces sp. YIM 130001]|uniref:hypothetical protein n=1 Tax=Streptomyces sp. YIM 130001 TaxID=2259644 RepID=UPI000E65A979|nr:hypothetical protein [Streptomyces sp. YIM 130001]RII16955.1 hypothetical protein DSC45_14425 [Streptomyces sp. YIM 130001]